MTAKRGFAAMTPEKRMKACRKGGFAVHAKGLAHEFTSEEAQAAGRKGGKAILKKFGTQYFANLGARGKR